MPRGRKADDDMLAERIRRGDRDAFAMLTTRYWTAVHRIAGNMLPDQAKAREVAEETFLHALRSPDWFPGDAPFKVSLYRLAIILSVIQAQPGPAISAESLLPQFDAGGRPLVPGGEWFELAGRRDLTEQIREGLEHVEDLDRAAFVLRAMEQVPLEEAALILRTSPEGIRERAHRACLLLTGFLGASLRREQKALAEQHDASGQRGGADVDQRDQAVRAVGLRRHHREEETGRHQERRSEERPARDGLAGIGQRSLVDPEQTDQREDDQHAGVRVPGAEERLAHGVVEVPRDPLAHQREQESPPEFDGGNEDEEDAGGQLRGG
jgi:RNA polymerase sigma-70 factor (ECF subfamily)